jgi:excisionase family DNA binding protein
MATTSEHRLLVSADELAQLTGWSKQSIYRRARRGEIPVVRTGAREIRFDPAAVRRWIAANTTIEPRGQQ